jgi:uncharacterized protein YmfQ (DUF2313 family)
MSRSADAVLAELASCLPRGFLWPDPGEPSLLAAVLRPLAEEIALAEEIFEQLLAEADPRLATVLLEDYERVLGPDPCRGDPAGLPLSERRALAHARWTGRGGQSIPYLIDFAAARGAVITIEENLLTRVGDAMAGDELISHPEEFCWTVRLALANERLAIAGEFEPDDLLYDFDLSDIECDLRRIAPAHTIPVFIYV